MRRRWLNIRKAMLGWIIPGLRVLPPKVATRMVAGIGRTEYGLLRSVRYRVDDAVERGKLYLGGHWDVPAVGRSLAGNQILWRTRDRLLDGRSDQSISALFTVEGRNRLDAALAEGKGAILLSNHFGAHMMPAHWLVRERYPLRYFMERPRHISRFLSQHFDTDGPTGQRKLFISRKASPAESAASILRASKVLAAGTVVMIACDVRWSGPYAVPAQFLGRPHNFSATWALLAAVTNAPVVPVFCRVLDEGSYHLEFAEPYHVVPEARQPDRAGPWVRLALEAIEERVRLHPQNSNEYFFWAEDDEALVRHDAPDREIGRGDR